MDFSKSEFTGKFPSTFWTLQNQNLLANFPRPFGLYKIRIYWQISLDLLDFTKSEFTGKFPSTFWTFQNQNLLANFPRPFGLYKIRIYWQISLDLLDFTKSEFTGKFPSTFWTLQNQNLLANFPRPFGLFKIRIYWEISLDLLDFTKSEFTGKFSVDFFKWMSCTRNFHLTGWWDGGGSQVVVVGVWWWWWWWWDRTGKGRIGSVELKRHQAVWCDPRPCCLLPLSRWAEISGSSKRATVQLNKANGMTVSKEDTKTTALLPKNHMQWLQAI